MRVSPYSSNPAQSPETSRAKGPEKAKEGRSSEHAAKAAEEPRFESADVKTDLSPRAKEFAQAKAAASAAPDVRDDKIAELKARIASGQYNVNPHAVADRLVDEHLEHLKPRES